jgi:hypothetical protein
MSSLARVVAVGMALCPLTVAAQIASIVRPPAARGAARAAPVSTDTSSEQTRHPTTQLTSLTAWVDSAVAANQGPNDSATVTDTAAAPHATPHPAAHGARASVTDGMRAPDTASPLPAIVLVGVLTLGAGLALSRGARDLV